jgi:hypothetical protein
MAASDKTGAPRGSRQAGTRVPVVEASVADPVQTAPAPDPVRSAIGDAAAGQAPYLKYAFANPYNLSLLVGGLAAAAVTLSPLLALVAVGGEAVWMLHAPGSPLLRRLVWDPKHQKEMAALEASEREARLMGLADAERHRVKALVAQQQTIRRLAAGNPSFTGDLLRSQLAKTDRLVGAFIDMAVTCARYEAYLSSVDVGRLERDRTRWQVTVESSGADDPQVEIARKNLAIIVRRQEKMKEIERYLSVARGQLDLIENSFRLIADQIVTMQSPQQLSGQLDELLDGVEAIRQTAVDTEQLLGSSA